MHLLNRLLVYLSQYIYSQGGANLHVNHCIQHTHNGCTFTAFVENALKNLTKENTYYMIIRTLFIIGISDSAGCFLKHDDDHHQCRSRRGQLLYFVRGVLMVANAD